MRRTISLVLPFVIVLSLALFSTTTQAAVADGKAGIVSTSSGGLNIRSSPSVGSTIIGTLKKGDYVTLISRSGAWWQVEYMQGKYGYCHANYINLVTSQIATVSTKSSSLNVRSGAGTAYNKVGSLMKGERVLVISTLGDWNRILYHGVETGYVSAQYLSLPGSVGSNTAITLGVPSFKQTDSRWANVIIGSSGKTMAQIGCATVAVAMMESYRTGTTIYPNVMAKKLNYTATGSVYWPSHYIANTNSSGYLTRIYELLKQGKPILFGAKNASGKQHWVVITGHTGGSVAASSFTIHDPGSNSRTTLQQFLNSYPTFYKYFHY